MGGALGLFAIRRPLLLQQIKSIMIALRTVALEVMLRSPENLECVAIG